MIKRFIIVLLFLFLPHITSAGDRILTVQSVLLAPYEQALQGFCGVCTIGMERVLLSEVQQVPLMERIARMHPDLILAVGLDALKALEAVDDVPIVFVMLLCPDQAISRKNNITGVNMRASAEVQLGGIRKILPEVRRIGVVFDAGQTERFIQRAAIAAETMNIALLRETVQRPREIPAALLKLRDQAELLWMIPDVTVMTAQAAEIFLLFSLENKIPIATFSGKYLEAGALIAFELDAKDMGQQAGEMANRILSGESISRIPVEDARTVSVSVNRTVARKFSIRLEDFSGEAMTFTK